MCGIIGDGLMAGVSGKVGTFRRITLIKTGHVSVGAQRFVVVLAISRTVKVHAKVYILTHVISL
ncbi:hypothetical protein D3C76_754720 [compost metagenome]